MVKILDEYYKRYVKEIGLTFLELTVVIQALKFAKEHVEGDYSKYVHRRLIERLEHLNKGGN